MTRRERADLLARLRIDAYRIATHFGLRYRAIEAERPSVKRRYGVCFSDGEIRVRLTHVKTGEPLRYSSLIATLCHELAHLRHFDHGPDFRSFNERLLDHARGQGIYQPARAARRPARRPEAAPAPRVREPREAAGASVPRRARPRGPEQLGLFQGT